MDRGARDSKVQFFHLSSKSSDGCFPEPHRCHLCQTLQQNGLHTYISSGAPCPLCRVSIVSIMFWLLSAICHTPGAFVSSLYAVIVWLPGNCQLVFHISLRKTSLGMVSLWPNSLLNGLLSQTGIHWRCLSRRTFY